MRWRQLRLRMSKVPEEQAREVTRTLLQLATGAQLLKYGEPPLADAWCQQWLDRRGSRPLRQQSQTVYWPVPVAGDAP